MKEKELSILVEQLKNEGVPLVFTVAILFDDCPTSYICFDTNSYNEKTFATQTAIRFIEKVGANGYVLLMESYISKQFTVRPSIDPSHQEALYCRYCTKEGTSDTYIAKIQRGAGQTFYQDFNLLDKKASGPSFADLFRVRDLETLSHTVRRKIEKEVSKLIKTQPHRKIKKRLN
ncbi:hypothetical protein TUMSATVNIG1_61390 (plasmid) [Vibrio nigripulchritudo]|uniref:hypothetical protein n=1 Tax=Vibrio nigripulchritudo TaxID=28173 RepID=UPI00190B74FC|nr:hypothetical protein [Vibrio nigripulchritudo]BCL74155.1 hypothetical protein VNTUMSATTG_60920 [Vibrio nigripulchritudo]BDU35530.1 hypothetical protein TUMSATVNIG1_61390 [Vibrio nigripulchritudo]